jgi:hypothetical protein
MTKKIKKLQYQDLENDYSDYDNIDYWSEDLQLTKVGENIFFDLNRWLSDQHLGSIMQILYVEKLQYEQRTYTIIGKKCMSIK